MMSMFYEHKSIRQRGKPPGREGHVNITTVLVQLHVGYRIE